VFGVAALQVFQEALHGLTPGGQDGQTDHNKQDPLKKRQKKSNDPEHNEDPPDDENGHALQISPRCGYYDMRKLEKSIDFPAPLGYEYLRISFV
jgi:hypothetical protein